MFPSAIMFGMSSTEFWEDDPQLYWAYRFSFMKKQEIEQQTKIEQMRLNCWLQGKINTLACSIALNNAFSKKHVDFPDYNKLFKEQSVQDTKAYKEIEEQMEGVEDNNELREIEFNYWARLNH